MEFKTQTPEEWMEEMPACPTTPFFDICSIAQGAQLKVM
jgi:hypothetical protein